MKKILALVLLAALLCGAAVAEMAGMPNPIVEIYDDDAFEDRLNIEFDADEMYTRDLRMSIIADSIGQVDFSFENVNGDPVECTLRFTRDKEIGESVVAFSGIHDSNMSEPVVKKDMEFAGDDADDPVIRIDVTEVHANTENCDIITWKYRDVYYCLTVKGEYSQMQMAEVFDGIIAATIDD